MWVQFPPEVPNNTINIVMPAQNIIQLIHLPGFGGNFLKSLFSLDPTTTPWNQIDYDNDNPTNRVECYLSVLHGNKKINHWLDLQQKTISAPNDRFETTITSIHPQQFSFEIDAQENINQRFLVGLPWDDFSNYWLMDTKENLDFQLARQAPNEEKNLRLIKRKFDLELISISPFLNFDGWVDEYVKISNKMGVNSYPDQAEKLYQAWYQLRVKSLKNKFHELSKQDKSNYCAKRLKEEQRGSPDNWQIFYENVRDSAWPDCDTESEFISLPDHIKQELIEFFHYVPQVH